MASRKKTAKTAKHAAAPKTAKRTAAAMHRLGSGERLVEVTLRKGYAVNRQYLPPGTTTLIPESLVATHALATDRHRHAE